MLRLRARGLAIMVVNRSAGGRTLSLSTTVNGTAVAVAGNVQPGVSFLPKSPSFHSGLDLLADRENSPIIMYCDPTIHLPRLHGESHASRAPRGRPVEIVNELPTHIIMLYNIVVVYVYGRRVHPYRFPVWDHNVKLHEVPLALVKLYSR